MKIAGVLAGCLLATGIDLSFEIPKIMYKLEGKMPYIETYPPLPTLDKIIVAGLSFVPLIFSKDIGAGSVAYGLGQLIYRTIVNLVTKPTTPATKISFLKKV